MATVSTITSSRPLRVAALVKQIPKFEQMSLGPDGRLQRDGLELHMNDYCRRAVAKGHEIAQATGGTLTVITLGPPSAENVLREAIAFGADAGIHITDMAFAGSDTWATAKALARAIEVSGPFDLVLMGRNSVDADTGQVPPELAAMLELPFATGVRELTLDGETLKVGLEYDDEWVEATLTLPAILSCAERLTDPCKIKDPAVWASVDGSTISRLTAADLGPGPWGQAASPTRVGEVRLLEIERLQQVVDGSLDQQLDKVMAVLHERNAFDFSGAAQRDEVVAGAGGRVEGPAVAVLVEPSRTRAARELLGRAATLAAEIGGHVVAIGPTPGDPARLAAWGADAIVSVHADSDAELVEEDVARGVTTWCRDASPWAVLGPSTPWGRDVMSRVAAPLDAGLTGDAVELDARDGRLVAWKPAFGGALVAEILCTSAVQMATVRAGVLPLLTPRDGATATVSTQSVTPQSRMVVSERRREDDSDELASAAFVVGVGQGVKPDDYAALEAWCEQMGAALCATRKVTDKGWMPRARQVGITGHAISPTLYIAIGLSGKFNHTAGVRSAGTIVAVNTDPSAEIFKWADVGMVGDWKAALEGLAPRIAAALGR